jgi:glycerophosphoryl diester phosphodiesterase
MRAETDPGLTARRILVHGHRGAAAIFPENTLAAFEYAIGICADAIELDVAATRDNVAVVVHDPHLPSGMAIHELTRAQLPEWLPALDQVLALAPRGDFQFNVEIKSFPDHPELTPSPEEFARLALALIRRRSLEPRVLLASFDFRILRAMKILAPEIRRSALWESGDRDFVSIAREAGASVVSPHYGLVDPEKVRDAHAAGLEVIAWTANTPSDWDALIAAQIDAIITDDPAGLIAHLQSQGLR